MISRRANTSLLVVAVVASMTLGVAVGFWVPQDDEFFELRKGFRIFGEVYEELVTGYVKPVSPEHLMRVGIDAMLDELDPYTTFLDEADNTDLQIITEGQYGGVGLEVGERGGQITVVAPVKGASGYKQGIRPGDVLTRINDEPVAPLSQEDVQTLLRGEPGTTVRVTVQREGASTPLEFTLTREKVDLENVTFHGLVGGASDVGYVKLERFTRDAASEVESALEALMNENEPTGIILDLRDNPGGLLSAAIGVAELFVEQGTTIVSTEGRLPEAENTYRSQRAPVLPDLPLAVLVNSYSASASEIVAGAVQDHDRGVVMGTTTYGKGLVQAIRSLPHNTSLKMTTAQYRTPSGRSIQKLSPETGRDTSTAAVDRSPSDGVQSATHETTHGRTVRDGDGLRPDSSVALPTPSALESALRRRATFFHYANHFAATRDTLPSNFAVTRELVDDFRAWLEREEIDYPTKAERAVSELAQEIDGEDDVQIEAELERLRRALRAKKENAFDDHTADLERPLKREILARYLSKSEQTAAMLPGDPQVAAAVGVLHAEDKYEDFLRPQE